MARGIGAERRLVRAAVALLVACIVVGILMLVRIWPPPPPTFGFTGFTAFVAVAFGGMGALILGRRPGNAIGWLLLVEGLATAVQFGIDAAPALAAGGPNPDPVLIAWTSWVSNVIWIWSVAVFGPLFLLFPDGTPLSPRWGPLGPLTILGAILFALGLGTTPGPLNNFPDVQNPVTFGGEWSRAVLVIGAVTFAGASALCAISLVVRWRRSSGDAREQMKWLAAVSLPFIAAGTISAAVQVAQYLMIGFGLLMPVAIAIAVLRHRLYDIDQVISRTVVYGALTAILAGLYTATLKLLQEGFVQVTGKESEGAVILSTLVIAAAFTPVRKGLEQVIDRRFKPAPRGVAAALAVVPGATLGADELDTLVRRAVREELTAILEPARQANAPMPTPMPRGAPVED
ncbi:MAG: hypothetical protein HY264_10870 [Chloroflexi bacterium]|nr:hypothetical protein [Chloroflexota bacterium]